MTQTPHNISQYCRQELCVVFFRFQLSRAKGTTGGYILLYKCILYVVYAGPLINLMMLGVREYKEELEQMMERVESQPTLFQKQTQVRALK